MADVGVQASDKPCPTLCSATCSSLIFQKTLFRKVRQEQQQTRLSERQTSRNVNLAFSFLPHFCSYLFPVPFFESFVSFEGKDVRVSFKDQVRNSDIFRELLNLKAEGKVVRFIHNSGLHVLPAVALRPVASFSLTIPQTRHFDLSTLP